MTKIRVYANIHPTKRGMYMTNEIFEQFYAVSKNRRIFTEKEVTEIAWQLVQEKKLQEQVKEIKTDGKIRAFSEGVGEYDHTNKRIILFDKMIAYAAQLEDSKTFGFSSDERHFFYNLFLLESIRHEMEHANQAKIIHDHHINTIEVRLLKLCQNHLSQEYVFGCLMKGMSIEQIKKDVETKIQNQKAVYKSYYKIAPEERLADYHAMQECLKMLEPIKSQLPHIFRVEKAKYIRMKLEGYNASLSPTITYLRKLGLDRELRDFEWYDENDSRCLKKSQDIYSLETRLQYGLPISKEEYGEKQFELKKTLQL